MCPDSKGAGGTMGEHQDHLVFVLPIFQVNQSKVCVLLGGLDDAPSLQPSILEYIAFKVLALNFQFCHIEYYIYE